MRRWRSKVFNRNILGTPKGKQTRHFNNFWSRYEWKIIPSFIDDIVLVEQDIHTQKKGRREKKLPIEGT
jgi:hypothetical protein